MTFELRLQSLANNVTEAMVKKWRYTEDELVEEGDVLAEMTTESEIFNIPVPVSGTLKEIVADEGDAVRIGDLLAILETREES